MTGLERSLRELGGEVAWPATPAFELDVAPAGAAPRPQWLRPLALGLALVLAALGAALALSPGARSAFLEIFRLRGATVELVETLPDVRAQRVDWGERVTREEAERIVGFELLDLGEPDAVFVRDGRVASLVYGELERPRVVLSQLRGGVFDGFLKKAGDPGTSVEQVQVDGEPGLYVSGDQHFVMFLDENGNVTDERTYLAGTVLLWNRGELLLRLEGDLARDDAVRLAEEAG